MIAAYDDEMYARLRKSGAAILDDAKAKVQAAGVAVDTALHELSEGRIHELVVQEAKAWKADLIVAGTHGRRGPSRFFIGSDAEQILHIAPVPMLLVRAGDAGN